MVVRSGRPYFSTPHGVFERLGRIPSGLMLDAGAALGSATSKILKFSPESHVIAIEPFQNNIAYFEKTFSADARVTLIRAAVADAPGKARFHVKKQVPAGAAGVWAQREGYSSVGQLESVAPAPKDSALFDVDVVTLDDVIGERVVQFCKMDVQGAEPKVLAGARRALREGRIGCLMIEFSGGDDVLEHLDGFDVFDQRYMLITRNKGGFDLSQWDIVEEKALSTGRVTPRGWPTSMDGGNYLSWYRSEAEKIGKMWTDLVAIRPDLTERLIADR